VKRATSCAALLLTSGALLSSCTEVSEREGFSEAEWAQIHALVLPDERAPDAGGDEALALLGQQLFFDRGLAVFDAGVAAGSSVACKDCHDPRAYFSDPRSVRVTSAGVGWTKRNSPPMVNVGAYRVWGLDGRGETLANQSIIAYQAAATMNGNELALGRALVARYADRYEALFGALPRPQLDAGAAATPELMAVMRNASLAWAAYLRALQTKPAPFDRWAAGEPDALTPAQTRGLKLFLGQAGCITCHNGPNFSDSSFHNLGLLQQGPNVPSVDEGRLEALTFLKTFTYRLGAVPAADPSLLGTFRTRSLRNVSQTGPYFHAGQYQTLREVIWFYDRGGDRAGVGTPSTFLVPLGLSEAQAGDLEAFLGALTGPLPEAGLLCDNSRLPDLTLQCPGGPR
jgi:cytochrome c peroxidase